MSDPIVFVNAALDEIPGGLVVLRGVVTPESLRLLQVDDYQREVLPLSSINQLVRALDNGGVPDIELGMRGDNFEEKDGKVYLHDPIFIIDGLQRVTAAKLKFDRGEGNPPHIGALVHFNTNNDWERNRFKVLNVDRTKLSPNIILRNWKADYTMVNTLYHLSGEKPFVMNGRISWEQRMKRDELISATTFMKVVGRLHSHMGPSTSSTMISQLVSGLQRVYDNIGRNTFRDNVKVFFDVIDTAYGVRRVAFKEGAVYMRSNFLIAIARLFSNHTDFWKEERLFVDAPTIRKLANFPYKDPTVVQLCSSGGTGSHEMLYMMLVNHINSGRRTRRLSPRILDYPSKSAGMAASAVDSDNSDEDFQEEAG